MKIKGGSVENTLDFAMFGDILVWAVTFFGLVPWNKLFGRKKDFHEQLKELSDEPGFRDGIVNSGHVPMDSLHFNTDADHHYRTGTLYKCPDEDKRVEGPWGVVPYKCRVGRRLR